MRKYAVTMKHLCAAAVALLFFASPCAQAAADADTAFICYYLAPNPQSVPDLLGAIDSVAAPMRETADWAVGMFLAEIFMQHPETAQEMRKRRDAHSLRGRYAVALAACQAKLPDLRAFVEYMLYEDPLRKTREKMLSGEFPPLADIPVRNAAALDALWGGFMASGKTVYVEKIITALGYAVNAKGKRVPTVVQMAARWSLTSNAARHPLVLAACRAARDAGTLPEDIREVLTEVIRAAEEEIAAGGEQSCADAHTRIRDADASPAPASSRLSGRFRP